MAIRRPAMEMEGPLTSRPDMLPNLPKVYHYGHIEPELGWVPNDYYFKQSKLKEPVNLVRNSLEAHLSAMLII
jgi:hypothetical protein